MDKMIIKDFLESLTEDQLKQLMKIIFQASTGTNNVQKDIEEQQNNKGGNEMDGEQLKDIINSDIDIMVNHFTNVFDIMNWMSPLTAVMDPNNKHSEQLYRLVKGYFIDYIKTTYTTAQTKLLLINDYIENNTLGCQCSTNVTYDENGVIDSISVHIIPSVVMQTRIAFIYLKFAIGINNDFTITIQYGESNNPYKNTIIISTNPATISMMQINIRDDGSLTNSAIYGMVYNIIQEATKIIGRPMYYSKNNTFIDIKYNS